MSKLKKLEKLKQCKRCGSLHFIHKGKSPDCCLTCGEPFEWFAKKLLTK